MDYQKTSLWKRTLGMDDEHVKPLKESFLDTRKNAEFLLDKIRDDFPNLTVHDITHVDSLWNVADTIIGEDYPINPLEGYVLGIAFLIHDAALSYDAVGGKDKLRDTIEWKDAYADWDGKEDVEKYKKECDFFAIRVLHAKYAEDILNRKFEKNNTTTFYIIGNDEYRTQFSDMIGKIAASHHWSIDEVESKLDNQVNPIAELPGKWEINEQKLACILRCADAGHIDNGRAPFGIYNSLIVNGVSRDHWESQTRLGQVRENKKNPEQLLITSTRPFDKNNFAAWNVAYDAVRLFDEELKKSNELLKPAGLSFPHIGVTGAESKEALSNHIKTKDWLPCSFGVHTGNVKALIENLGGSNLYGEKHTLLVALRELIQNARDAIQARCNLQDGFGEGRIIIRYKEEEGRRYFEVQDNGIGMSLDCIKHYLLDFGKSYWRSPLSKKENKGLRSSGFKSVGKFGIGFYSVFMVAESVEVITRKYIEDANAVKIEFPTGLTLSPILSYTTQNTLVSTIVRFELKENVKLDFSIESLSEQKMSLITALRILVAGLDTDVYYADEGTLIHRSIKSPKFDKKEWLAGLFSEYIPYEIIKPIADRLEIIKDEKEDIKACIAIPDIDEENIVRQCRNIDYPNDEIAIPAIETICGLSVSINGNASNKGFVGYINGNEMDISRKAINLDNNTLLLMQKWLIDKYHAEYNKIVESGVLSKFYSKAMSYFKVNTNKIIEDNANSLYASYKSWGIEVGTIQGLKKIHLLLFSGLSNFAGQFRVHKQYHNSNKRKATSLETMDSALMEIEHMVDDEYEQIISKYIHVLDADPFMDGNKRAVNLWVNLLLKEKIGMMINWRKVDVLDFYIKISFHYKDNNLKEICDFLKGYLSTEYEKEISTIGV